MLKQKIKISKQIKHFRKWGVQNKRKKIKIIKDPDLATALSKMNQCVKNIAKIKPKTKNAFINKRERCRSNL